MAKVSFPYRVRYMGRHYSPHEPIETSEPEILIAEGASLLGVAESGTKPEVPMEGQTNLFEEPAEEKPKKTATKRAPRKKAE